MDKRDLVKELAELAKTIGQNALRSEFAEMLVEAVEPAHLSAEAFSTFFPVSTKNFGDTLVKRVTRGRYAVQSMVPGVAHLVSQTSWQDTHTWVFDRIICGTRESLANLRNPSLTTVEKMVAGLKADLMDNIFSRVFVLLGSTWNATDTPSNYILNAGNVTKTNLDLMIESVLDKAGSIKAIVGVRRALLPVYEFTGFAQFTPAGGSVTGFSSDLIMEYMQTNKVSAYKSIPLIELPQVKRTSIPGMGAKLIPENRIVVVGGDAGEVMLYGPVETQEHTDTTIQPADYQVHAWQQFGMLVNDIEKIGVIALA